MADGTHADARMERLLYILPAAGRKDGATLEELARTLDTTVARIEEDIREVTDRAYYHPGGWPDDVSILLESDRIRVFHARGFERPVRLSPRETLCLALALRTPAAATHVRDADARRALLRRSEAHLGAGAWSESGAIPVETPDHGSDPTGIRETLLASTRERRPCAIVYAKAGAEDMEVRIIHPYAMASAAGDWYAVAWCAVKEGMRVFRLDRILEAAETDGTFTVPVDFDATAYVSDARVYHATDDVEVRVRYSPRIARWVREGTASWQVGWEEKEDGSVVVRHRVADPHWVVRHALHYGAEAEVLEPEPYRELVRDVVGRMTG